MRTGRIVCVAVLAALMLGSATAGLAQPTGATEASGSGPVGKALEYLKGRQQSNGGFAEPGSGASDQLTTWVVCGLAAAGQDPASWKKSGKSPLDFLAARAGGLSKLTELEKYCLAVSSAHGDPRSFGGRNLVEDIKGRMSSDGHIGDMINEHCWGVLALAAAAEALPDASRGWLASQQNIDGGFGYSAGSGSDPDDTGAAMQALIASGEPPQSNTISRAVSYMHFCQSADGGFAYQTDESNVGSAAWAVQGLVASGQDVGSAAWAPSGKTPLDYLLKMQQSDGHFKYTRTLDSNPTWMTAEAIPALQKKPFPLKSDPAAVAADTTSSQADSSSSQNSPVAFDGSTGTTPQGQGGQGKPYSKRLAALNGKKNGQGKNSTGVQGAKSHRNTVALFLVICVLLLATGALAYVSLHIFFGVRS